MAHGDVAHRRPQLTDAVAREPVVDACPLTPRTDEPRARENLEMLRRVGHALRDLARELVHRAFALGKDVDDLGASSAPERLCHRRQRIEQSPFGRAARHRFSSYHLNT